MSIINELEIQDLDSSRERGYWGSQALRDTDDTGEDFLSRRCFADHRTKHQAGIKGINDLAAL